MKAESILFLLSIHEGNELRDQLPGSAYDELAAAGLLDGTDITEKGYAYVRLLCDVPEPVQTWADPRSFASAIREALRPSDLAERIDALPAHMKAAITIKTVYPPPPAQVIDMPEVPAPPPGYQPNPGQIPGGVDRAADVQIIRANGKHKTLPAQAINWSDNKTPDRVIGWRYAAAAGEGRIHTPGETMPAPDA